MSRQRITPSPVFSQILTGHFREGAAYSTWRPAGTSDWLLIQTLAGCGRFGNLDGELMAPTGHVVLIPPGSPHEYGTASVNGRWELLWAHFHPRPHFYTWLDWPYKSPGLRHLALEDPMMRRRIAARFLDVHRLAMGALRCREAFALNALEEVLLLCDTQNPKTEGTRMDSRVRQAMEFLCLNVSQRITLDALATHAGISVSRLSHLFREQVGMTPQQFLEAQRIHRAQQLLEVSSRSVKEIALEVGFEDPFYFSLRFKKATGLSPRTYRQRAGKD